MDDATKPFLYNNDSTDSEENDSVEFVKSGNISKRGTTSTESIVNILTSKPSFLYVILMLGLMSFHIVSSFHVVQSGCSTFRTCKEQLSKVLHVQPKFFVKLDFEIVVD